MMQGNDSIVSSRPDLEIAEQLINTGLETIFVVKNISTLTTPFEKTSGVVFSVSFTIQFLRSYSDRYVVFSIKYQDKHGVSEE